MSRTAPRFQPQVVALEDRTLLSGYFSYAASGNSYDYQVTGMPDLDQRRSASGSIIGLPGNGYNHCVPTAATNVMAFLANHGHPALMPGGARNWQAATNYNTATAAISTMGSLMDTSASTGTNSSGGQDGLQDWLDAFCPGKFTSGRISTKDTSQSTVDLMASLASSGVLVIPVVGWYTCIGNQYFRNGGHALTLTDAEGTFGIMQPKSIKVNDPAWEANSTTTSQSSFTANAYTVTAQIAYFDGVAQFKEKVNGLGANNAYLDGFYYIDPKAGVTVTTRDTTAAGGTAVRTEAPLAADLFAPVTAAAVTTEISPPQTAEGPAVSEANWQTAGTGTATEIAPADDLDTGFLFAGPALDATPALRFHSDAPTAA